MRWSSGRGSNAVDLVPADVSTALSRMWSRLARAVEALPDADWEHPSRCSEWRAVDVVNHIADMNGLAVSVIVAGMSGERTSAFDGFDPRTTPQRLLDAADRNPAVARRRLLESLETMLAGIDSLADSAEVPMETPLGRQPMAVSTTHLLWDTWLHERDIFLPLGQALPEVADEVRLAALYSLRMIGFFAQLFQRDVHVPLRLHGAWEGTLLLDAGGGDMSVRVVDAGAGDLGPHLRGDAATAVDALCGRGDLAAALDGPDELRDALSSLRMVLAGS